ncbi:MAG: hypothetical protein JXR37_04950, partial [Kiritimatiellae bacterium]|nr:hypothetical protein [Kiritimatiellia bacterium]
DWRTAVLRHAGEQDDKHGQNQPLHGTRGGRAPVRGAVRPGRWIRKSSTVLVAVLVDRISGA